MVIFCCGIHLLPIITGHCKCLLLPFYLFLCNCRVTKRRQHEQTEEFRQKYRWRAGVEATMSQYDRLTGVKHLRVRGFKAVRFAAVMKAIAVNIARAIAAKRPGYGVKDQVQPNTSVLNGVFYFSKNKLTSFWVHSLNISKENRRIGYMPIIPFKPKVDFLRRHQ